MVPGNNEITITSHILLVERSEQQYYSFQTYHDSQAWNLTILTNHKEGNHWEETEKEPEPHLGLGTHWAEVAKTHLLGCWSPADIPKGHLPKKHFPLAVYYCSLFFFVCVHVCCILFQLSEVSKTLADWITGKSWLTLQDSRYEVTDVLMHFCIINTTEGK